MKRPLFPLVAALLCVSQAVQAQEQFSLDEAIKTAESHEAAGRTEEAAAAWKLVAVKAPPDRPVDGHHALARLQALLKPAGRFEELESAVRATLETHPQAGWALGYLAVVLQMRGKTAEALETYRKIAEAGGAEGGWASYYLGKMLVGDKKTKMEAADAFLDSLRMAPELQVPAGGDAVYWANFVALEMIALRRFDDARRIWEGMIALPGIEPGKRAQVCFFLAMLDYRFGRFLQAEGSLLAAMELAPTKAEYVSNLGLVYLSWGKPEQAKETWLRALEIDPAYADAVENLAIWHMKRGEAEKAAAFFKQGLGLAVKALARDAEAFRRAKELGAPETADLESILDLSRTRLFRFETYLRSAVQGRK